MDSLKMKFATIMLSMAEAGKTPESVAIETKINESIAWAKKLEPIVRVHKKRPLVKIFIRARIYELLNSPAIYAMRLAKIIPPVLIPPKIALYAACPIKSESL